MTSGKVVHFDTQRGFGFLAPADGGEDVFLHVNDIDFDESALRPGTEVTFDVEKGDKGLKAVNVAVVGGAPAAAPRRDHRDSRPDHRSDRPDRREAPRRDAAPRAAGTLGMQAFLDEITEQLLDSSDDLTAGQIIAIRQRFADFAFARGWVTE
ncbi:Cold-shock DNA-binding domain protein OS=Tsukamurella paurometabola (strain ATCC 8368 / DSM/ CCUG 35730 / CIP 100753 / JCM 10117 / KCTC 9821 / NBRC 16120/ NCIMB 702349 / NCTC 13040) OX=521096 GN=Tpau_2741 PE=4 SV=1 [Tsukamurella paurometabola]|uniref:Cold-shock DNA-binding domain protein n=1 Tax=Tsukamurella paurometabola (strain ATCC 8368 / DSM 20162 / CCUG 35730 / CIP 100753 / JCM 10117 / KCTC 9821 / NBRC 16120 / NCIMB 702349 / NCTC 13040) TaxID=521096 RepID=D5USR8_TSUPD|nr:cold shock domain-containing protein [Tsukamurella paurometabola]ADG79339.1 cold-shock DNA-binding domain protein [Tsukamurella paurometabola DSM 20162]SUP35153.1 Cold shock-like protein CspD [Tsukamurella paurometabola]